MLRIDNNLIMAWLDSLQIKQTSRRYALFSIQLFGDFLEQEKLSLDCTTPADIRRFINRINKKYKSSFVLGIGNNVKRFYRWAEREGLCRDVAANVKIDVDYKEYSSKPIDIEEAIRVINCAESLRDRAILSLMIRCDLKPRDIVAITTNDILLIGDSGEVRLSDGTWLPLTQACIADLLAHLNKENISDLTDDLVFTATTNKNKRISLSKRRVREITRFTFQKAEMPYSSGEYRIGSASVNLAIAEGEPAEVIVALCDKTYPYRRQQK